MICIFRFDVRTVAAQSRSTTGEVLWEEASLDELIASVSLEVKQRSEIAVIDPDIALCRHSWLGMKRNARACKNKHAKIIGTVPNRDHLLWR